MDRDTARERKGRRRSGVKLTQIFFFPVSILYLELILGISCGENIWDRGLIYTALFSFGTGLIIAMLCSFKSKKLNRVLSVTLLSALSLWFVVQTVYFKIFKTYMTVSSYSMAGEAIENFWKEMFLGIFSSIVPILFLSLPLVIVILSGDRVARVMRPRDFNMVILGVIVSHIIAFSAAMLSTSGVTSIKSIYRENFVMELAVPNFGLVTSTRLDIKYMLFGRPEAKIIVVEEEPEAEEDITEPPVEAAVIEYDDNVLEIDFDALMAGETDETILGMHKYFAGATPTSQNEYTGMFEGKNLIWLVGEAFSNLAVDAEITPTLYKLANEGFVFNNFYTPDTGFSTSGGEFMTLTSLLPSTVKAFPNTGDNYMPFGFGNIFTSLGYTARAYHNHTYTYYGRDISHPNMGYIYKGLGNGLEVTKSWPESDLEMMELSIPEYIGDESFHTYYMTVSGHMNYTFSGNVMASKHKEAVAELGLSEGAAAYLACNIELDLAMEYLLAQLDEAGILEDTVIVMSGDHYPYGLEESEIEELLGYEMENPSFDVYHSSLILWCADMEESVQVDKYCSSLDIMPTLANLFGLEYDSRLVMGTDILSDSDPIVIFANKSWISQEGVYNSKTDTFASFSGEVTPDEYLSQITNSVYAKYNYSEKIVDYDYYSIVLGGED